MGQKINPILVRLQYTNKFFDSCWYSKHFYTHLLHQDLAINLYFNGILKQIQYPRARLFIQHSSRKSKINIFFCNIVNLQNLRFKFFQITRGVKPALLPFKTNKKNNNKVLIGNFIKNYQYHNQKYMFYFFQHLIFNKKNFDFYFLQKQFYFRVLLLVYLQTKNKNKYFSTDLFLHQISRFKLLNNLNNITIPLGEYYIKKNNISISSASEANNQNSIINLVKKIRILPVYSEKYFMNYNRNLNYFIQKINGRKDSSAAFQLQNLNDKANNYSDINTVNFKYKQSLTFFYKKLNLKYFFYEKTPNNIISNNITNLNKKILLKNFLFREHIESIISKKIKSTANIFLFKCLNDFQSALFLAEELVYYLERRVTFRKIKNQIVKQLENHKMIKGIRITFSGRVGGKSKKAQRAKTECIKYGETSLHVFSSKVDFASKSACTPFGLIGIKVWICYR